MSVYKRPIKSKKTGKVSYRWYARRRVRGKDVHKSVGSTNDYTKAQAKAYDEEWGRTLRRGILSEISAKVPTLGEYSKEYLDYQKNTVKKRSWDRDEISIKHLNDFFGPEKRLNEITVGDARKYQKKRLRDFVPRVEGTAKRRRISPSTVNRELACLKNLFNVAKEDGKFFGENPVSRLKFLDEDNTVERTLTAVEEKKLLSNSPYYLRPILFCALHTGMRKSEIIRLMWHQVNFDNNLITLEATNTKSRKKKKVPINSDLRSVLLEQKIISGTSDHVFLNSAGKPYRHQDSLKKVFLSACHRAGIKGLRFHDLRHTAATRMLEAGAPIVAVSKILGHQSIATTMKYAHPEASLGEAVEKLTRYSNSEKL